jgi:hypothetical protein
LHFPAVQRFEQHWVALLHGSSLTLQSMPLSVHLPFSQLVEQQSRAVMQFPPAGWQPPPAWQRFLPSAATPQPPEQHSPPAMHS